MQSCSRIVIALEKMNLQPIDPSHELTCNSRLVHDLGLVGDDFDDLISALEKEHTITGLLEAVFVPSEASRDAYFIAMADSFWTKLIPGLRQWYLGRLGCPAITISEVEAILFRE